MDADDIHSWRPFHKSPSNFSRPKSNIRIKRAGPSKQTSSLRNGPQEGFWTSA